MADVDADADAAFFLYYNRCCFFFFSTQSRVYLFFSVSVPHLLDAAIQWKRIQAFFDAFFP